MHSFEELNSKINRLKREGGVGWDEPGRVYAYDGKEEELEHLLPDIFKGPVFAHIATNAPSLDKLVKFTAVFADGSKAEAAREDMQFSTFSGGETVSMTYMGQTLPVIIRVEENGGLYVYSLTSVAFVSRLEFAETIHPISDKYLPEGFGGGGLPVVELETVLKSGAALTEAENVAILEALNTGYPVVVRFKMEDGTTSTAVAAAAGHFALTFRLGMIDFIIQSTGENGMNFTVITGA